jgi:hypothetical protein
MHAHGRGVLRRPGEVKLRAPFPWFGGKSRVSPLVWSRFADVPNYIEPFAGSLAVLLGRPTPARIETVNDVDAYLANFWRALKSDPDAVAHYADWPVNETDLHARHRWLVESAFDRIAKVKADPDYFDAKVAGWWVWGQCLWIGSGWCQRPELEGRVAGGGKARGVQAIEKRPGLTGNSPGVGVHRRWNGGGKGGGSGVNAQALHQKKPMLSQGGNATSDAGRGFLSQQKPALNGDAGATGHGIHASAFDRKTGGLHIYLNELADRFRRVRVCCGDWTRVLTPSVTTYMGVTGVLLDPPYSHELRERCYSEDHDISVDVRRWAIENGDNPLFRIALCGYEDEHAKDMPASWEKVAWKAHGGYSRTQRGKDNRDQERIWFSPYCQRPSDRLPFDVDVEELAVSE